jgi:hypothetical protein
LVGFQPINNSLNYQQQINNKYLIFGLLIAIFILEIENCQDDKSDEFVK